MIEGFKKLFVAEDWMPAKRVLQRDAEWWDKLRQDCALRFGSMAQKELSGRRAVIEGYQHYRFGDGQFISHRLMDGESLLCHMIIARISENQIYLALSRRLTEREVEQLFSDEDRALLPDLGEIPRLYVREQIPNLKDWLTIQYTRRIEGIQGEKKSHDGERKRFLYSLFVNESNDKALEIEWFEDNSYEVYATLYRPLSDIVQVWPEKRAETGEGEAPKPAIRKPQPPLIASPKQAALKQAAAATTPSAEVIPLRETRKEPKTTPPPAKNASVASPVPAAKATEESPNLSCNIRVAAKIIDEALRNDMQLSDVVRRILGLPIAMEEAVHFNLPLSTRDYQQLAERYGIDRENHSAIRQLILEDLIDFTGEREKRSRPKVTT